MKYAVPLLLFVFFACAMGERFPKTVERKDQDKIWRPCQDFETAPDNPIGKFCNRVCKNRKGEKCQEWKTNIKDASKADDFKFFRANTMILIDEDYVF